MAGLLTLSLSRHNAPPNSPHSTLHDSLDNHRYPHSTWKFLLSPTSNQANGESPVGTGTAAAREASPGDTRASSYFHLARSSRAGDQLVTGPSDRPVQSASAGDLPIRVPSSDERGPLPRPLRSAPDPQVGETTVLRRSHDWVAAAGHSAVEGGNRPVRPDPYAVTPAVTETPPTAGFAPGYARSGPCCQEMPWTIRRHRVGGTFCRGSRRCPSTPTSIRPSPSPPGLEPSEAERNPHALPSRSGSPGTPPGRVEDSLAPRAASGDSRLPLGSPVHPLCG